MLANKVVADVYMLGAGVSRTLARDSDCTSVVNANSKRLGERQDTLAALREQPQPLPKNFRNRHILRIGARQGMSGLFLRSPRDRPTYKRPNVARDRQSIGRV